MPACLPSYLHAPQSQPIEPQAGFIHVRDEPIGRFSFFLSLNWFINHTTVKDLNGTSVQSNRPKGRIQLFQIWTIIKAKSRVPFKKKTFAPNKIWNLIQLFTRYGWMEWLLWVRKSYIYYRKIIHISVQGLHLPKLKEEKTKFFKLANIFPLFFEIKTKFWTLKRSHCIAKSLFPRWIQFQPSIFRLS